MRKFFSEGYQKQSVDAGDADAAALDAQAREFEQKMGDTLAQVHATLQPRHDLSMPELSQKERAHLSFLRAEARNARRTIAELDTKVAVLSGERARRIADMDRIIVDRSDEERVRLETEWCREHAAEVENLTSDERELMEHDISTTLADFEIKLRAALIDNPQHKMRARQDAVQRAVYEEKKLDLEINPESFYALHADTLKRYVFELNREGGLAETPYVRMKKRRLGENVRAGVPTLLSGDLGSGKTELALSLCRDLGVHEPYILSFRKDMDPGELYGKTVITATGAHIELERVKLQQKYLEKTQLQFDEWKKGHGGADPLEEQRIWGVIDGQNRILFEQDVERDVITKFMEGQIYQAMREGKPVILDEFNAAPHALLVSLNHLLTRRAGDTIRMQQDSNEPLLIKEGFCFIFTGNMSERYGAHREKMDKAFLSRLYRIDYDYLPQVTKMTYESYCTTQRGGHEKGVDTNVQHELFDLLVAMTLNPQLTTELTEEEFKKLWDLAEYSRRLQDNFAGNDTTLVSKQGAEHYRLKDAVPSIRSLKKVIDAWKQDDYVFPIDYYLYDQFIAQANGTDRAFLFTHFVDAGFFADTTEFRYNNEDLFITRNGNREGLNPDFRCDVSAFLKEGGAVRSKYFKNNTLRKKTGGARTVVDRVYGEMPLTHIGVPNGEEVPPQEEGDTPFDSEGFLNEAERALTMIKDLLQNVDDVRKRVAC